MTPEAQRCYVDRGDGRVEVVVHVVPGAGRTQVAGRHGSALKVRVAAPPERGRANEAVLELLAKTLGLARSTLELTAGHGSRSKRVQITTADAAAVMASIDRLLDT